ncbi:MAG: PAS domain S-box protein, partial [Candidatus Sericytochromatia bacterium]
MKTYDDLLEEISRLKDSEKKYRTIVENANESICIAKNEFLIFVNTKMSNLLGYSKEELLSSPFTNFIHEDDKNFVLNKHKSRLNGNVEPEIYDFRVIKKDKTIIWIQISSNIITWDSEKSTLNYLTDITDRKLKEKELKLTTKKLKESEEIFFKVFESSPDGIVIVRVNDFE